MELKVWVEGIQRVVCGVNEKTTCQDVVYALAHATGKTGRFTLIERWRNNERLLAPGEQPLKVLLKWGELSNDVQFILQWSPLEGSSSSGKSSAQSPVKSGPLPPQQNHHGGEALISDPFKGGSSVSSSSYSPGSTNPGSNGVSKKLPYSSASQVSFHPGQKSSPSLGRGNFPQPAASNGVAGLPGRGGHEQMSSSSLKGAPQRLIHNSDAIKDKMGGGGGGAPYQGTGSVKSKELSAPPPYREPPNPINYQGKVSPSVSSPSLKGLPPYREPPPPTMAAAAQSPVPYPYQVRAQSSNSPVRGVSQSGSQSYFGSSANSSSSSLINANSNGGTSSSSVVSASGATAQKDVTPQKPATFLPNHGHIEVPFVSFNNNPSDKSERNLWANKDPAPVNGESGSSQNGSMVKSLVNPMDSPNSHYKELVRLVNLQREKLTSQQAELTQYDAEIMFWEGKAKEQQRNMEFITKEISRLELISSQNESQVLSLSHLEEESEYVRQESESLKSELSSLRADMTKCESELDKCKSRLRRLSDDLLQTQSAVSQRQEEWHLREAATLAEVDRLKKELELARRETDAVSDLSGSLDKEVHSLESSLAEKKKQMEQLVSAMKEANLQSLIINPPEEGTSADGGAHQRSGSTRRMIGSPRQLENAAPTSKNPHGVWV